MLRSISRLDAETLYFRVHAQSEKLSVLTRPGRLVKSPTTMKGPGLGSSVWTHKEELQEYCVSELAYGAVFLNKMVASDPRLPFGGVKKSGYGRELAEEGLKSFVNAKTIYKVN